MLSSEKKGNAIAPETLVVLILTIFFLLLIFYIFIKLITK